MTTDFFMKKSWIKFVVCGLACVFVISFCLYALLLHQTVSVWHGKSFYFLLSKAEHVEAGRYDAVLNGGAGYPIACEGSAEVALAVYLTEKDANAVQSALTEETEVMKISVDTLYFKTRAEKANMAVYQSGLSCLHSCMQVLQEIIFRLDNGETQQSALRLLSKLKHQFTFMEKQYQARYPFFSKTCKHVHEALREVMAGTVYASDLRYLLCELAVAYIDMAGDFSL